MAFCYKEPSFFSTQKSGQRKKLPFSSASQILLGLKGLSALRVLFGTVSGTGGSESCANGLALKELTV